MEVLVGSRGSGEARTGSKGGVVAERLTWKTVVSAGLRPPWRNVVRDPVVFCGEIVAAEFVSQFFEEEKGGEECEAKPGKAENEVESGGWTVGECWRLLVC